MTMVGNASVHERQPSAGAHPGFFTGGGGAEPEAIYKSCLILKIMLQKPCHKYNCNITLFVTAFT